MGLFGDDFYSTKTSGWSRASWKRQARLKEKPLLILFSLLSGFLLATAVFFGLGLSGKEDDSNRSGEQTQGTFAYMGFAEAYNKVAPAIVSISSYSEENESGERNGAGMGSGIIFRKSGGSAYVVTNNHVIEKGAAFEVVLSTGERRTAELVGSDQLTDLAVLEISGKGIETVAEFGDSDALTPGVPAIAIGNPLGGFAQTVTAGIISWPKRVIPVYLGQHGELEWELEMIQTDAAINQGNSGGALVDLNGKVIGINSLKVADMGVEGLGFAIPINQAKPVIETLLKDGRIKRPFIGVATLSLVQYGEAAVELKLPESVKRGLVVIEASGPAQAAGLRMNDVIVELDGHPVDTTLALRKYLYANKQIGEKLTITFYRDGKKMNATVTLGEYGEYNEQ